MSVPDFQPSRAIDHDGLGEPVAELRRRPRGGSGILLRVDLALPVDRRGQELRAGARVLEAQHDVGRSVKPRLDGSCRLEAVPAGDLAVAGAELGDEIAFAHARPERRVTQHAEAQRDMQRLERQGEHRGGPFMRALPTSLVALERGSPCSSSSPWCTPDGRTDLPRIVAAIEALDDLFEIEEHADGVSIEGAAGQILVQRLTARERVALQLDPVVVRVEIVVGQRRAVVDRAHRRMPSAFSRL